MIAGDHLHADAGGLTILHGLDCLLAWWINHSLQSQKNRPPSTSSILNLSWSSFFIAKVRTRSPSVASFSTTDFTACLFSVVSLPSAPSALSQQSKMRSSEPFL